MRDKKMGKSSSFPKVITRKKMNPEIKSASVVNLLSNESVYDGLPSGMPETADQQKIFRLMTQLVKDAKVDVFTESLDECIPMLSILIRLQNMFGTQLIIFAPPYSHKSRLVESLKRMSLFVDVPIEENFVESESDIRKLLQCKVPVLTDRIDLYSKLTDEVAHTIILIPKSKKVLLKGRENEVWYPKAIKRLSEWVTRAGGCLVATATIDKLRRY